VEAAVNVARGLLVVAVFLLGALDALITARLGIPRLAWLGRKLARAIADEYRRGYHNAVDVEIIEENG
jgi:hypothetical protein